MIKPGFIKAQVVKSAANKEGSPFLRRLVFSVVDESAKAHRGPLYSTKCFQVSGVIRAVPRRFGIESRLWVGAICVAEVFEDPQQCTPRCPRGGSSAIEAACRGVP
jgi:hypothetical protein